jgi:hypothetical protein
MKKLHIKSNLIIVIVLFLVTACEQDIIMFDSSKNLVGFSATSLTVVENVGGSTSVYLGAVPGTAETTTVTLVTDTEGIGTNAAVEGVDYNLSAKSLSVSPNEEAAIDITPVDNDVFTGDKRFYIVISSINQNYKLSVQSRILVTISDDEHPLKQWIGTYIVTAVSYGNPGGWDEEWTVATSPVQGNINQLAITGLGNGSTTPLIANVDKEGLTISIEGGQAIGEAYGSGNGIVGVYYGTDDLLGQVYAGENVTAAMLTAAKIQIPGALDADGTIHIDKIAMVLTDYDWCWDVFNTTWTKQ